MEFTVTFQISPSGVFGIEEPHTTVVPPTSGSVPFGFLLDTHEHRVIDNSKEVSVYRGEQDKVDVLLRFGDTPARIVDNVLTLDVSAEDYQSAYDKACAVAEVCLQHLVILPLFWTSG